MLLFWLDLRQIVVCLCYILPVEEADADTSDVDTDLVHLLTLSLVKCGTQLKLFQFVKPVTADLQSFCAAAAVLLQADSRGQWKQLTATFRPCLQCPGLQTAAVLGHSLVQQLVLH